MKIGFSTPEMLWRAGLDERGTILAGIADWGIDHIFLADHVSFRNGSGSDGFVEIAGLSQLHSTLGVMISVYLLPLRHPVPVARQLATMHRIAPGRTMFGVGIGGEDRSEVWACGVNPATRGKRADESLELLRQLATGEPVSFEGRFFKLDGVSIRPAPNPAIPIIVGGRSDAALDRAARYGDGWVGAWVSAERFASALATIDELAAGYGRRDLCRQHGYQPWAGVADTLDEARARVKAAMESFYKVPFERFEKYTPCGRPDEVARELIPYVDAGCTMMNLKIVAGSDAESIAAAGEIAARLRQADA